MKGSSFFWDYFGRFSIQIAGVIYEVDLIPAIWSRKTAQKNPKSDRTLVSKEVYLISVSLSGGRIFSVYGGCSPNEKEARFRPFF